MTWFNPNIYCKQNLKEDHRKSIENCERVCKDVIEHAQMEYEEYLEDDEDSKVLASIKKEIVASFVEYLKYELGDILQNECVSMIDSYENDVPSVEDPATFDYEPSEEDEDEDESEEE